MKHGNLCATLRKEATVNTRRNAGICACLFAVQIMLHQKLLAIEGNFNYIIIMRTRFGCALLSIDFEVLSYFNSRTVGRPSGQQSVAVTSL